MVVFMLWLLTFVTMLAAKNGTFVHHGNILVTVKMVICVSVAKIKLHTAVLDNILINSTDNILNAGILQDCVSHHRPIFCMINIDKPNHKYDTTHDMPKFDFCQDNIDKFQKDIVTLSNMHHDYTKTRFNFFIGYIKEKINENFLIKDPETKTSKRNALVILG